MIDVSAAFAGLEASIMSAKALRTIAKKFDSAELQNQIADLLLALAQAKIEGAELKARVWELEKAAELQQDLEFDGSVYRKKSQPDHAYCQRCWDIEQLLVHLHRADRPDFGAWFC